MADEDTWLIALIKIVPAILWVVVAVWFIWLLKDPLRQEVIPRLTAFEGFGMKVAFQTRAALDVAIANLPIQVPEADRDRATRRAAQATPLLHGARILWIDDTPSNNMNEQKMFQELGIQVAFAASTDEALIVLQRDPDYFDILISDMGRNGDSRAGLKFLEQYRASSGNLPVIFYVGNPEPTPEGAFGLTVRPDELLHLVVDAIERSRI